MWEEYDKDSQQLIAIHIHHFAWDTERTIWMDGRPHPPEYALHTSMGFSTGKWEGDILAVTPRILKKVGFAVMASAAQRPCHVYRAFHPSRRQPHSRRQ